MPPFNRKYKQVAVPKDEFAHLPEGERAGAMRRALLAKPIAELTLNVRVINTLEDQDIVTIGDLLRQTYETLVKLPNFGDKTLTEVRTAVEAVGLNVDHWAKPKKVKTPKNSKHNSVDPFELW